MQKCGAMGDVDSTKFGNTLRRAQSGPPFHSFLDSTPLQFAATVKIDIKNVREYGVLVDMILGIRGWISPRHLKPTIFLL